MHRRHQQLNVPIEIVRTVVAVSEAGSLSKAGEIVGLTQPAVSSQMKRIESLMGGALFKKTANGSIATDLGKLVLHQARKILDANDQMLRIAGIAQGPQPLRVGLSTLFVQPFIKSQTAQSLSDIFINTDHSVAIAKGLVDGYIDIACIFENPEIESDIGPFTVNEFSDPLVWVRSKDFVLSPGTPIPVLTWPGDDWMIRSLTRQGLSYKIVFNSPDYHAKLAAVEAGIGLTAIPASMVPETVVRTADYYLPVLPPIKALLCSRRDREDDKSVTILKQLSKLFFSNHSAASTKSI
jgi:DNA-binding transcriptional LysR family regulator